MGTTTTTRLTVEDDAEEKWSAVKTFTHVRMTLSFGKGMKTLRAVLIYVGNCNYIRLGFPWKCCHGDGQTRVIGKSKLGDKLAQTLMKPDVTLEIPDWTLKQRRRRKKYIKISPARTYFIMGKPSRPLYRHGGKKALEEMQQGLTIKFFGGKAGWKREKDRRRGKCQPPPDCLLPAYLQVTGV